LPTIINEKKIIPFYYDKLEEELTNDDYLVISLDYMRKFDKHFYYNLIDKAKKANVHLVYFLSRAEKHLKHFQLGKISKKIERHLKATSLNYCIFRVNESYQNFLQFNKHTKETKKIQFYVDPDSSISFVDENDISETFLATVLHVPPQHASLYFFPALCIVCHFII
jgi:hypothetical protein